MDLTPAVAPIEYEIHKETRVISRKHQLRHFQDIQRSAFDSNFIMGITGRYHPRYAQTAAFMLFRAAARYFRRHRHQLLGRSMPLWHSVYGTFADKLRDSEGSRLRAGSPMLLVIDGLAVNSTAAKFESVRDLLEIYSNTPRIVVSSGTNPVDLFYNHIHQPLNYSLYFDEILTKRKQV